MCYPKTWIGWRPSLVLPRPSTVVTWQPCKLVRGMLHAVTVTSSRVSPVYLDSSTVQAPQEPSPHDNLVPVNPEDLRYCSSVVPWFLTIQFLPFIQNCNSVVVMLTQQLKDHNWLEDSLKCCLYSLTCQETCCQLTHTQLLIKNLLLFLDFM